MSLSAHDARALADARVMDAQALLRAHRYSAAYYLCGYVVELGLKAIIAKQFIAGVIPDKRFVNDIHSHNLAALRALAGLENSFRAGAKDVPIFEANWLTVAQWSEASRYEMVDQFRAAELYDAVVSSMHGVLPWLKNHW